MRKPVGSATARKVLHISNDLADGGAQGALFRLCTTPREDVEHIVVSLMGAGKYGPLLEDAGVQVFCLNMRRSVLTFGALWQLYQIVRNQAPDAVQTWMYHANLLGGLIARLGGCANLVWGIRHSDFDPAHTSFTTRLVNKIGALSSRWLPRKIIACATRAVDVHVRDGYDQSKFSVVPNGFDTTKFAPDAQSRSAVRASLGIAPDVPLVGLVGRWHPQKDHANLLAAFAQVRSRYHDLELVLVGEGCVPENDTLAKMIGEADLESAVHLLGRRSDTPAIMNAIDLHVLSSSHGEAFPNVVAEAMACGTPCVVTDIGDAAFIVGDNGWVVPVRDSQALAAAIGAALTLKSDPALWEQRKFASRAYVSERFTLQRMADGFHEVWFGA